MFKICGLFLLTVSGYFLFTKDVYKSLSNYKILNEAIKILQLIKLECGTGKPYVNIFQNSNNSFFREYDVSDPARHFNNLNIDSKLKNELTEVFVNLGKREAETEKQYIEQYIELFDFRAKEYKSYYDKNYKSFSVAGISLGLVIFIVII